MRRVLIFGSTGSIGTQSLEVLACFPEEFQVTGLTAFSKKELLESQFKGAAKHCGPLTEEFMDEFMKKGDIVINAVPGFEGLKVSVAALRAGKILLSANKESLAIAGPYLKELALENGAEIRPLDSEASAIWKLIHDHGRDKIKAATLTCSGGPFYGKTTEELAEVSVEEALNHPTWKMGPKVSLDSATLINKVLEVYEVHHLFDIPLKDLHIVIHRQSVVHGMVHTHTKATKMHITQNDMRLPISYALNHPEQPKSPWPIIRSKKSELSFDAPDASTFRSLQWLEMHKGNPNFPIALNALNDLATAAFLRGDLSFLGIYDFIEAGLEKYLYAVPPQTLDELIEFHDQITQEYRHYFSGRTVHAS